MKLLMFSRFYFPHIGGVEKHVKKVSEVLLKKGFDVTIFTEKFDENLPEEENLDGIKIYRIKTFKSPKFLNKFVIWFRLLKFFDLIKQADIIHCHDIFFWYLPFKFLFPKKPVYITFHGWEGIFPIPKRFILARKIWEKLALGNICVGDYLEKWYGTKPDFISYGGISFSSPPWRSPLATSEVSSPLVFVGRLDKDVGFLTYLKALSIIKKSNSKIKIEFYGGGTLEAEVTDLGKVYGFVSDVTAKISKARFVFASSYLSILEALSLKKLVFYVWENPLKRDYLMLSPLKNFIVSSSGPEELAKKVLYYLNHLKEEKKLVERVYGWVGGQTWEKVANLYLKLWKVKIPEVST